MYEVVVAPIASEILTEYAGRCAADVECAMRLVDCYDKAIGSLREMQQRGLFHPTGIRLDFFVRDIL
ncbi:MAG: hypothetical protein ACRC3H_24675 [Lachnospiraceae bacterium]